MIFRRWFWFPIFVAMTFQLAGCAKLWNPVFFAGKSLDQKYYTRPVYYPGKHYLCEYEGPHVHYSKWGGPVSVSDTDPKEIKKKYRYPGMEDSFKTWDAKCF